MPTGRTAEGERVAAITGGRGAIGTALDRLLAAAFAELEARVGRLDLLVLAAGVTALGTFEDTTDATFRHLMDINFHGAVACLRSALPALRRSRSHVVALSSVAGFAPVVGRPAYVASKHALTGTFEALRPEFAPDGIGVTLVHPTFLDNPLVDANADPDRRPRAPAAPRTTAGALITPDEVAQQIVDAVAAGCPRIMPRQTAGWPTTPTGWRRGCSSGS